MITIEEMLHGKNWGDIPLDHQLNLQHLHYCVNFIRTTYAAPILINNCYRTKDEHIKIYENKNIVRMGLGFPPIKIPQFSMHLIGAAIDLDDPNKVLKMWLSTHMDMAERLGVYFEDFDTTPGWVHAQIYPPASGKRVFLP